MLIYFILSLLSLQTKCGDVNEAKVDYYLKLLNTTSDYVPPVDAKEYEGNYFNTTRRIEYGVYDFIVIGAGSTGGALAGRLSEEPRFKTLLIDAGDYEDDLTRIAGYNYMFSKYDWNFNSKPQTGACQGMVEKICPFPRGKAIGGSTMLNALLYIRGNAKDFDKWNELVGGGWSYEEVLPYFRKAENNTIGGDPVYHGSNGPLTVSYPSPISKLTQTYIDGHVEAGKKYVEYNGREQIGVSAMQVNVDTGRRMTTGYAYVIPAIDRRNFFVSTHSYVTKILFNGKRAYGVEFMKHSRKYIARASKEIILSAGTIGSPAILMHSGIGPRKELTKHSISVIKDLPVGRNMHDHPAFFGLTFDTNYTEPKNSTRVDIENVLKGYGFLSIPLNIQTIAFHLSKYAQRGLPDIEFFAAPFPSHVFRKEAFRLTEETFEAAWKNVKPSAFTVMVVLLHPKSRGQVTLKSNNPFDYPIIDPQFLTDKDNLDIDTIYEGIKANLELLNTEAFKKLNVTLYQYVFPACKHTVYMSKDYWYCTIRQLSMNIYHPAGTCAMGFEKNGGVVDKNFNVHGIRNLRVADVSVFPVSLSGHPSAPATMLGEKLADLIKEKYKLYIV